MNKIKLIIMFTAIFILVPFIVNAESEDNITIIENGKILEDCEPDFTKDVKKIEINDDLKIYTDYPWGYSIEIPKDMDINYDNNGAFIRFFSEDLDIKVSKEFAPYEDVDWYFDTFLNKYILNDEYRKENNIELIYNKKDSFSGYETKMLSFKRITDNSNILSEYVFAYVKIKGSAFYNFFFKTDNLKDKEVIINKILSSLKVFSPTGDISYNTDIEPNTEGLSEETKELFERINNTEDIMWGFFTPNGLREGNDKIKKVEKSLGYDFPIILQYQYLDQPFPLDEMEKAYNDGKIIELTLQSTVTENDGAYKKNGVFDIIDGRYDDLIINFAKEAKIFNHPFLFRLNNEMNSDWCNYSGLALLSDTDLYKTIWKRIFNIFKEEGVDNAIWIFNPNDNNFPPTNWNLHFAYFPGEEYVHMIGLTGYNTGNYYEDITNEKWRSFESIYDNLVKKYRLNYSKYPWIITEFASSSVGGDKSQWIRDMFNKIKQYTEIKGAVWWSHADFDYREGKVGIPARRYWLEENIESLIAFQEGLNITNKRIKETNSKKILNDDNYRIYNIELDGKETKDHMFCKSTKKTFYVPLRRMVEYFNADLSWDKEKNKIIITRDRLKIVLECNDRLAYVNGVCKGVGDKVIFDNDTTMIPLDFIVKTLGGNYSLDHINSRILMNIKE